MSAVTRGAEGLAEFFKGLTKGANRVSEMDAAQRAKHPRWMDFKRGEQAVDALEQQALQQKPFLPPLEERLAARTDAELQSQLDNLGPEDEYFGDVKIDYAPQSQAGDLAEEPEIIKQLERGSEGYVDDKPFRPNVGASSRTEVIGVSARARQRAADPKASAVAAKAKVDPASVGMGWYDDTALKYISGVAAKQGRLGSYVGGMRLDDAASLVGLSRRDEALQAKQIDNFVGSEPIVLTVRESDGILHVERADGPIALAQQQTPGYLEDVQVPVVLKNSDGTPFVNAPRRLVWDRDGVRRVFQGPEIEEFANLRKFDDPTDPNWFDKQPVTPIEVGNAVATMFSPKGITLFSKINRAVREIRMNSGEFAWQVRKLLSKEMKDPEFFKQGAVMNYNWKLRDSFQMANEKLAVEALDEQRSFYKDIANNDPVILERMRNFAYDSPYKLSLYGETDPALKDLPIVFWHTDQNFYNPELTGSAVNLAQFATPGEMGYHMAPTRRQADHLLPEDTSGPRMVQWYQRRTQQWKNTVEAAYANAGLNDAERKAMNKALNEVFNIGERVNPAMNAHPTGKEFMKAFEDLFNTERLRSLGLPDDKNRAMRLQKDLLENEAVAYFDAYQQTIQTAMIFRGRRPLILMDLSRFDPTTVAEQLLGMPQFEKHWDQLNEIRQSGNDINAWREAVAGKQGRDSWGFKDFSATHKQLLDIIESEGFDHILYPNFHEVNGMPSVITWREEQIKFSWAPLFSRRLKNPSYAVVPALPLGSMLDKENNNGN